MNKNKRQEKCIIGEKFVSNLAPAFITGMIEEEKPRERWTEQMVTSNREACHSIREGEREEKGDATWGTAFYVEYKYDGSPVNRNRKIKSTTSARQEREGQRPSEREREREICKYYEQPRIMYARV